MKLTKQTAKARLPELIEPVEEDLNWNDEVIEDVSTEEESKLVVYSRDWTIGTIISQIEQENIDLNPKFQRRNAWDDTRRSKLIESLIVGLPVPEIVLAEDPRKRKAFIVIDGKQRLLTIAGFVDPTIGYWTKGELTKLGVRADLNGKTYEQMKKNPKLDDELREFMNADMRCTIISNFDSDDALYDIFHRLNAGSVPLSTQELRQVLHKGPFADYLIEITNKQQPIHRVLRLAGPDSRLRDVEIVLRFVGLVLFGELYQGNLKKFLDQTMENITKDWCAYKPKVAQVYADLNTSIERLETLLGTGLVGRKFTDGAWESRFNRVLFEVEAYYLRLIPATSLSAGKKKFVAGLQSLLETPDFRATIEATTKTNERYELRFQSLRKLVNTAFGTKVTAVPITA